RRTCSWRSSPPMPTACRPRHRLRPWSVWGSRDEPGHLMEWVVFVLVAVTAIGTALGLVIRPNPLHGALFLVANLFCVAVLYLMLRAEFLALAQVIVYAGAIMVLFIFAIMLLIPGRAEEGPDPLSRARRFARPPAAGPRGAV